MIEFRSVGIGARTCRMAVGRRDGMARFPTLTEPARFANERYGACAQVSSRFTDPDLRLGPE
ncbi:hypothetical protein FF100_09695 [Methylobacterium terricola]|uniref:Uncharacterized protein n=1 Tax=Methylobacterium terricola TaxID=2583531 RepID=A0A5C4LJF5_9HYPH|nr:hypothetical protein [Methylobacterium terricola]TNC14423.1 hypothetical protein FF100_09695 [Methylobacterium terricola]